MIEINKIINGDSLEYIKGLPDNSIDCILTDPPYNIAKSGDIFKDRSGITDTKTAFGHYDTFTDSDYLLFMENYIIEFERVCKDGANVLIFLGREYINIIERIFENHNFKYKNTISIVKRNPLPHFRKNGFRSGFELGLWLCKGDKPKTFNFLEQSQMINYDLYVIGQNTTEHPNEKPLSIIKKYIKILSNENDIILDCFMGSGTTCVAAKELNRKYIGIEINKEYCEIGEKRLENTQTITNRSLI